MAPGETSEVVVQSCQWSFNLPIIQISEDFVTSRPMALAHWSFAVLMPVWPVFSIRYVAERTNNEYLTPWVRVSIDEMKRGSYYYLQP